MCRTLQSGWECENDDDDNVCTLGAYRIPSHSFSSNEKNVNIVQHHWFSLKWCRRHACMYPYISCGRFSYKCLRIEVHIRYKRHHWVFLRFIIVVIVAADLLSLLLMLLLLLVMVVLYQWSKCWWWWCCACCVWTYNELMSLTHHTPCIYKQTERTPEFVVVVVVCMCGLAWINVPLFRRTAFLLNGSSQCYFA